MKLKLDAITLVLTSCVPHKVASDCKYLVVLPHTLLYAVQSYIQFRAATPKCSVPNEKGLRGQTR